MSDALKTKVDNLTIGIAGCGAMGLPMLKQVISGGFDAIGYDIRPAVHYGGFTEYMAEDAAAFSNSIDILISVVRDQTQTFELCLTTQKIFAGETYPRILILSSTLSPQQFHAIAAQLPSDVIVVDAPMSGAPIGAENGTLTFMVGAEDTLFEYLLPLFQAMGDKIIHVGAAGSGMAVKVLNNYVAAASVVSVRRALEGAEDLGLDRQMLLAVMKASSGGTWYGDNFDAIDWSRQGYEPGNTIAILEKDVGCALEVLNNQGITASNLDGAVLEELRALKAFEKK